MPSITSEATIARLRDMLSRYGIPQQLVSDNGSQFTSEECCKFMKANGINQIFIIDKTLPFGKSYLFFRS